MTMNIEMIEFVDKKIEELTEQEREFLFAQVGGSHKTIVGKTTTRKRKTSKNLDTEHILARHKKYITSPIQPARVEAIVIDMAKRYGLTVKVMRQLITVYPHFIREYLNHVEPHDPMELKTFFCPKAFKFVPNRSAATRKITHLKRLKQRILDGTLDSELTGKVGSKGTISLNPDDFGSVASGW